MRVSVKQKCLLIPISLLLGLVSCNQFQTEKREIIAKTESHILYKDEVLSRLPVSLSEADSINYVKSYVDNWVNVTILYEKACDNIADADSAISQQVERFRKELYINAYEQLFLQQKLDTLIPQKDIDAYYDKHKSEYILETSVVKPILIVFPLSQTIHIEKVETMFFPKKNKDIDYDQLKDYCFNHCQKFSFSNEWVTLNSLKGELPFDVRNESLSVDKSLKFSDTANVYFVRIVDQLNAGNRMPVELAHDKIAKIILQTRKIELLKNMRNKIYQDAQYKKQFEVYY